MAEIQRYPAGLLEVLGAKTSGVNPAAIDPRVSGVVDLLQFYGLSLQSYQQATGAPVEGASIAITVPANQWWLLHDLSLRFDKTATATAVYLSLRQKLQANAPGQVVLAAGPILDPSLFGSTPASDVTACHFTPPIPRVLPPGTSLLGVVDILGTDATVALTMDARVAVLT